MANESQRVRQAVVALVSGDATLQGLCGRATDLIRSPGQLGEAPLPMLVLGAPIWDSIGRRMTLPLGAVAEDGATSGATATVEALLVRLEDILSAPGFNTQGVDAVPLAFDRGPEDIDPDGSPTLTIAEAAMTLLVFA